MGECKFTNFYKCYECNINLCDKCQTNHDYSHNIMDFGEINYLCGKHKDSFAKYCNECKIDICCLCEEEHSGHKLTLYGHIIPDRRRLINDLEKLKECIHKYDEICKEITTKVNEAKNIIIDYDLYNEIGKSHEGIIMIVNEVRNIFNSFYNLKKDIISGYDNSKKYYHILINLKEINDNNVLVEDIEDINKIIQENNIKKKFENIIKIYKKINNISEEEKLIFDVEKLELKEKVKKIENNYKDLEEENEQIKTEIEELEEINKNLEEENEQIKTEIEESEKKYKDLEEENEQITTYIEEIKELNLKLKEENAN